MRLEGYRDSLAAHGVAYNASLVVPGLFNLESGREAAATLLRHQPRPTALFAANDEMAAGAMVAAKQAGLSVPDDVSVAGFDDSFAAKYVWPPLTTVHQPIYEMANAATRLLLARIRGHAEPPPPVFAHGLVIRESTAPPADSR